MMYNSMPSSQDQTAHMDRAEEDRLAFEHIHQSQNESQKRLRDRILGEGYHQSRNSESVPSLNHLHPVNLETSRIVFYKKGLGL